MFVELPCARLVVTSSEGIDAEEQALESKDEFWCSVSLDRGPLRQKRLVHLPGRLGETGLFSNKRAFDLSATNPLRYPCAVCIRSRVNTSWFSL